MTSRKAALDRTPGLHTAVVDARRRIQAIDVSCDALSATDHQPYLRALFDATAPQTDFALRELPLPVSDADQPTSLSAASRAAFATDLDHLLTAAIKAVHPPAPAGKGPAAQVLRLVLYDPSVDYHNTAPTRVSVDPYMAKTSVNGVLGCIIGFPTAPQLVEVAAVGACEWSLPTLNPSKSNWGPCYGFVEQEDIVTYVRPPDSTGTAVTIWNEAMPWRYASACLPTTERVVHAYVRFATVHPYGLCEFPLAAYSTDGFDYACVSGAVHAETAQRRKRRRIVLSPLPSLF